MTSEQADFNLSVKSPLSTIGALFLGRLSERKVAGR